MHVLNLLPQFQIACWFSLQLVLQNINVFFAVSFACYLLYWCQFCFSYMLITSSSRIINICSVPLLWWHLFQFFNYFSGMLFRSFSHYSSKKKRLYMYFDARLQKAAKFWACCIPATILAPYCKKTTSFSSSNFFISSFLKPTPSHCFKWFSRYITFIIYSYIHYV